MVGHLDVPGLTDGLPTSLTPAAYRLLRDDYGFDGLVVTDDLGAMKAVTGHLHLARSRAEGARRGADQALWSSGAQDTPRSVRFSTRWRRPWPTAASTRPRTIGRWPACSRPRTPAADHRARAPAKVPTRDPAG
jgi:hypothetical protein